jgi:flagellar hook protein FlgE
MSFQQGLSGLNASARNLDVIGNNIANANTVGFKSGEIQFADMYATSLATNVSNNIGFGVTATGVQQQFVQGGITSTSNPLDVAVNGRGFYVVSDGAGIAYTRNGQFQIDKDGYLVSTTGGRLQGYSVNASGGIVPGNLGDLSLTTGDIAPAATSAGSIIGNLDARKGDLVSASFDPTDPATFHAATSMTIYDSLGNAHALTSYYVKTGANTWDVFAASDGTLVQATPVSTLTFATDGSLDTAASPQPIALSVPLGAGPATPLAISLDLSGFTQYGSAFGINDIKQDGYGSGSLSGFSIGNDGTIAGRYTNGQTKLLGQIALADFTNPNGLQPIGNNSWVQTAASGQPLVGTPQAGSFGELRSSALEESNVDLTAELVNLITAQRSYQANAQTIRTQDQVLQTLVNLR